MLGHGRWSGGMYIYYYILYTLKMAGTVSVYGTHQCGRRQSVIRTEIQRDRQTNRRVEAPCPHNHDNQQVDDSRQAGRQIGRQTGRQTGGKVAEILGRREGDSFQ